MTNVAMGRVRRTGRQPDQHRQGPRGGSCVVHPPGGRFAGAKRGPEIATFAQPIPWWRIPGLLRTAYFATESS